MPDTTAIDWPAVRAELLAGAQVRELAGALNRRTLTNWRARTADPFPPPVVSMNDGRELELWSRSEVTAWLERNPKNERGHR